MNEQLQTRNKSDRYTQVLSGHSHHRNENQKSLNLVYASREMFIFSEGKKEQSITIDSTRRLRFSTVHNCKSKIVYIPELRLNDYYWLWLWAKNVIFCLVMHKALNLALVSRLSNSGLLFFFGLFSLFIPLLLCALMKSICSTDR